MSDPLLKSEVHAERNTGILATGYDSRIQTYITGQGTPFASGYAKNHILRDLNRRLYNYGLSSYISDDYDAGFRSTTLTGILAAGGGGGGAVALLLDVYTNAYGAYSVRRLRTAYSGPCLRIREDGGDTEIDIPFNGNSIDQAAIISHCGANNGYVTTWYDQSGNEKNITQSTAANQPLIFNGSAVSTDDNGNVQLEFDGANDSLLYQEPNAGANDTSEFWVGEIATNNRGDYCWGGGDFGAGQGYAVFLNNNGVDRIVLTYSLSTGNKPEVDTNGSNITNNDPFLIVVRRNYSGRTANLKLNNDDELYSAVSSTGTTIHEGLVLMGKFNSGREYMEGKVSEFIRFNEEISDAIATSIANDINEEYTLYV
jgi:hypothetical protein